MVALHAVAGAEKRRCYGVSVNACDDLDLPVVPDPQSFAEHMLIDFSGLSANSVKVAGKRLRAHAVERGWLYET